MDVPYKGYTIIANSERQPDGRWLPVADLEVSERGVVTAKPPLRATALETRATRADADGAAVKMAKAWIDANEREGSAPRPSAPTPGEKGRDAPAPRGVAPARAAPPARSAPGRPAPVPPAPVPPAPARPAPAPPAPAPPAPPRMPQEPDWAALCQAVGLDSDEKVERLSHLLVVQFLLDRLVTVILAGKLASSSESSAGRDVGAMLDEIAPLPIPARIDLASRLGMVAPGIAESIVDTDRVRNRLLHFKPPRGKAEWDVSAPQEIASPEAGDRCVRKGIEAAEGLISALRARPTEA